MGNREGTETGVAGVDAARRRGGQTLDRAGAVKGKQARRASAFVAGRDDDPPRDDEAE